MLKNFRIGSCIFLCLALVLCICAVCLPGAFCASDNLVARADGLSVSVKFDKTEYAIGDTVTFDIIISGVDAGADVSGEITVGIDDGLSALSAASPIAVSGKASDDGNLTYSSVTANVAGEGAKIKISANLSINSGEQQTVSSGDVSVVVKTVAAASPTPAATPTPVTTATPVATGTPSSDADVTPETTEDPSETPTEETTVEPTATMTVILTPEPTAESGGISVPETDIPAVTPSSDPNATASPEKESDPIPVGAVVFWSIVSLIAGVWIGIWIGSIIWRKKAVFMTSSERKIIGRY